MNCREFLIVFEEGSGLTEAAALHLKDCSDCRKTSCEQTLVWHMIDNLPRVDAPNNFDFRVKRRIADSKPKDFQPQFLPILRYVLPLGLAVLILGFFIFKMTDFSDRNIAPQLAGTSNDSKATPSNFSLTNQNILAVIQNENSVVNELNSNIAQTKDDQERQIASSKSPKERQIQSPKNSHEDTGGGSHVSSLTPIIPKYPRGLDPNQTIESSPEFSNPKSFSADEILTQLGIESVLENGRLQVKSIRQNSLAERSGVKIGDVVEAIDGRKISSEPIRAKTIEGKTLTVRRGAEKIEITLQN